MKKKHVLVLSLLAVAATAAASSLAAVTFALFERSEKLLLNNSGDNIPIVTDAARNTSVYVVPAAWTSLLSGNRSVDNCYIVACMYKNDDSQYEFQFIRTCDETKTLISENATTIDVSSNETPDEKTAYKFSFDLTYYDRISFHRFGYTANLATYMGVNILDHFTSKWSDDNPIPLDWRNIDKGDSYRRYDATHRQVKPASSNVFQVTSPNSGGSFGFLAWGSWYSNLVIS